MMDRDADYIGDIIEYRIVGIESGYVMGGN